MATVMVMNPKQKFILDSYAVLSKEVPSYRLGQHIYNVVLKRLDEVKGIFEYSIEFGEEDRLYVEYLDQSSNLFYTSNLKALMHLQLWLR